MLSKHLVVKTQPKANPENIILFGSLRVTVLFDSLIRVEKSKTKTFEDGATQSVWYRNMPKVDFFKEIIDGVLHISTSAVDFFIKENDFASSYAIIGDKVAFFTNEGNLLGTSRTLDGYDGDKKYLQTKEYVRDLEVGFGVCSKTGVAVLDDKNTLILGEDGKLIQRNVQELDSYVFAFGNNYLGAVKALYEITGKPPIIPRYALGNWWSRYHAYTDKEYLHLLDDFERAGVPISVATIDMDWHYSNYLLDEMNILDEDQRVEIMGVQNDWQVYPDKGYGWTGYTWNKNLFPDYKAFLQEIKNRDIKITLNLHPAQGVRFYETQYEEFAKAMGINPQTKRAINFDITDDNYINNYFKLLHKPYEQDGVEFWWIDWQQGTNSKVKGLDPLWALNHYHTLDNAINHKYALIMSRFCLAGSHRYPLGFSGDTYATWTSIDYLPKFTNRATNIGYTWWSHDIGGHMRNKVDGNKNDELTIRYLQYGVFNPIMRMHTTDNKVITNSPFSLTGGRRQLGEEQLKLRHKLVPYIFTADYNCNKYGEPLIKPTYYVDCTNEKAYEYENSYFFGSELFVAPITSPNKNGVGAVKAYLPKGKWTDIFTGAEYTGGRVITFNRYLDSIPVLAKAGGVIPMATRVEGNNPVNPKELDVMLYNGNNTYTMYEDLDSGESLFTTFKLSYKKGAQKVKIKLTGDKAVMPENRILNLQFKNIASGSVKASVNGKELMVKVDDNKFVSVVLENLELNKTYEITVSGGVKTFNEYLKERALHVFTNGEDVTFRCVECLDELENAENKKQAIAIINNSKCSKTTKAMLKEQILYF